MDFYLGQIFLFAGNFAPRGSAFCQGQLLAIQNYSALFSILGTTYGGDGRTTFGLPDLQGRAPIGEGQGPGLSNRTLGSKVGSETVTLTENQLPPHSHTGHVVGSTSAGTTNNAAGNTMASAGRGGDAPNIYTPDAPNANMQAGTVVINSDNGRTQPVNNVQPVLAINYCIAIEGIFPSRS